MALRNQIKRQNKPVKLKSFRILGLSSAIVVVIEPNAEQQNNGSTININKRPAAPADAPLESGSIGANVQYDKPTVTNNNSKLSN
jgi:hypothetical protein